jgi:hypothetical protein
VPKIRQGGVYKNLGDFTYLFFLGGGEVGRPKKWGWRWTLRIGGAQCWIWYIYQKWDQQKLCQFSPLGKKCAILHNDEPILFWSTQFVNYIYLSKLRSYELAGLYCLINYTVQTCKFIRAEFRQIYIVYELSRPK